MQRAFWSNLSSLKISVGIIPQMLHTCVTKWTLETINQLKIKLTSELPKL